AGCRRGRGRREPARLVLDELLRRHPGRVLGLACAQPQHAHGARAARERRMQKLRRAVVSDYRGHGEEQPRPAGRCLC
uniref:Uncharacterized protein n=1 Tax=Globisporangium ultimum (strain ATCC 200006 / CBS 805.95 / DAOM BR144) TaxID=431595 RepID=K3XBS5_GLOUD